MGKESDDFKGKKSEQKTLNKKERQKKETSCERPTRLESSRGTGL